MRSSILTIALLVPLVLAGSRKKNRKQPKVSSVPLATLPANALGSIAIPAPLLPSDDYSNDDNVVPIVKLFVRELKQSLSARVMAAAQAKESYRAIAAMAAHPVHSEKAIAETAGIQSETQSDAEEAARKCLSTREGLHMRFRDLAKILAKQAKLEGSLLSADEERKLQVAASDAKAKKSASQSHAIEALNAAERALLNVTVGSPGWEYKLPSLHAAVTDAVDSAAAAAEAFEHALFGEEIAQARVSAAEGHLDDTATVDVDAVRGAVLISEALQIYASLAAKSRQTLTGLSSRWEALVAESNALMAEALGHKRAIEEARRLVACGTKGFGARKMKKIREAQGDAHGAAERCAAIFARTKEISAELSGLQPQIATVHVSVAFAERRTNILSRSTLMFAGQGVFVPRACSSGIVVSESFLRMVNWPLASGHIQSELHANVMDNGYKNGTNDLGGQEAQIIENDSSANNTAQVTFSLQRPEQSAVTTEVVDHNPNSVIHSTSHSVPQIMPDDANGRDNSADHQSHMLELSTGFLSSLSLQSSGPENEPSRSNTAPSDIHSQTRLNVQSVNQSCESLHSKCKITTDAAMCQILNGATECLPTTNASSQLAETRLPTCAPQRRRRLMTTVSLLDDAIPGASTASAPSENVHSTETADYKQCKPTDATKRPLACDNSGTSAPIITVPAPPSTLTGSNESHCNGASYTLTGSDCPHITGPDSDGVRTTELHHKNYASIKNPPNNNCNALQNDSPRSLLRNPERRLGFIARTVTRALETRVSQRTIGTITEIIDSSIANAASQTEPDDREASNHIASTSGLTAEGGFRQAVFARIAASIADDIAASQRAEAVVMRTNERRKMAEYYAALCRRDRIEAELRGHRAIASVPAIQNARPGNAAALNSVLSQDNTLSAAALEAQNALVAAERAFTEARVQRVDCEAISSRDAILSLWGFSNENPCAEVLLDSE